MSDNVPDSPVPTGNVSTTERTRLLNTSTTSYSVHEQASSTVITMSSSSQETHHNFLKGSGNAAIATTRHLYNSVISAGQPSIPTQQLTEKIQDILVFSEIKKKQQERALIEEKKQKKREKQSQGGDANIPASSSSSSSSSSSDSDSDAGSTRQLLKKKLSEWSLDGSKSSNDNGTGKRLRKRDYAVDALKLATDKWKTKHGWATGSNNSSSASLFANGSATTTTAATTLLNNVQNGVTGAANITVVKQMKKQVESIPSSAESVFDVAKNASVCAVLALLHERRQSSGHSLETDMSLQSLALSTLNLGLKTHDKSASHVVLYEMLTTKWLNGKSALDWAVENDSQLILNDARVQRVIEDLWQSGPSWRHDPTHPSNIWVRNSGVKSDEEPPKKNFACFVICRTFEDFLARWPSAKYQAWLAVFSALVYLAFHLAVVSNVEYTSDTPFVFEYIYYIFVVSDLLLEAFKLISQPFTYLKKISSYISLVTVGLLASSFIIRFFTLLVVESIEDEYYLLNLSFTLLILATPLMFFRFFATSTDLCWSTAKTNYVLHQCFVNSIWVFGLGLFVIISFWIALGALQFNDIHPLAMLRLLVLGALHAPEIGDTLYYQPQTAGLLLAVYLFLTVVILGSLLTASFLSTVLEINSRIETVKRAWIINRCLKSNPVLNVFIPSVFIDLIFGIIRWFARVVCKRQTPVLWIEKAHQVFWYIIYSPVILLVGIYEFVTTLLFRWKMVRKAFHPDIVVV
ncbi:hypothetical protein [Parasitella parasitica]|uniref:Ion transport domain-containing protein n=1 Tax=Parasitella parasitica TaxID=35722 RepID=A0A0B7MZV0_9FUNG|nr:hypothetical protein [Parasitella parasitica]